MDFSSFKTLKLKISWVTKEAFSNNFILLQLLFAYFV
jgi:hypothetical protein